jgi:hypothetical protein
MNLTDIPEGHCLFCGHALNAAVCVETNELPRPGDITCCEFCATWMIFDEELRLIRPNKFMRAIIARHPGCQRNLSRIRQRSLWN